MSPRSSSRLRGDFHMELNVGCGKNPKPGMVNVDISGTPSVMGNAEHGLPFRDDTFDAIHAEHVLEHFRDLLPASEELWRVAKPGAKLYAQVPYAGCDIAFEDPTHVRYFTESSFLYLSQPIYWRSDYGYRGDWKLEHLLFVSPAQVLDQFGDEYVASRYKYERNLVVELRATLVCVKPARPQGVPPQDRFVAEVARGEFEDGQEKQWKQRSSGKS